jgi:hypothetical protein
MKQFKIIDVIISLVFIIVFVIDAIWNALIGRSNIFAALGYGLFLIGAWHIISMFLHIVKKWKTNTFKIRIVYYSCVALILIILFIPLIFDKIPEEYSSIPLIFCIPMAFFYTGLCTYEILLIHKKQKNDKV